jgi:hypothetical protein
MKTVAQKRGAHKSVPSRFALLLCFVLAVGQAWGERRRSDAVLKGKVVDPDGIPMPATVRATSGEHQFCGVVTTDVNGDFEFSRLSPGRYTIETKVACFRRFRRKGLQLTARSETSLDIRLEECEGSDTTPPPGRKFWTRAERKASSAFARKLIERAERLPCTDYLRRRQEWLEKPEPNCINREAVDYYFALVNGFSSGRFSRPGEVQDSAYAHYVALAEFDENQKLWLLSLRLTFVRSCGNLCGEGFVQTRGVYFDERANLMKIVDDDDCDCAWIS